MKLIRVWLSTIAIYLTAFHGLPVDAIEPTSMVYRTVDEVELKLHVFESNASKADKSRAAIVFFFGGGWSTGSPDQFFPHCAQLAELGMVAMSADYRVKSRHGVPAIECVRDAKAAVSFVRANAKRLGVDPNRIAAGGGSAGGHLAAAIATVPGYEPDPMPASPVPNALVLFNPALVLAPVDGIKTKWPAPKDLPKRIGADPVSVSPVHHLAASLPPTIIFHGTKDTTVPFATVELFAKRAHSLGAVCVVKAYEGEGHGFFNHHNQKNYRLTSESMVEFLDGLGYFAEKKQLP